MRILSKGGTTPSTGMIRAVRRVCSLPIMVMIRPRGGHFCFSSGRNRHDAAEAEAVLTEEVAGIVDRGAGPTEGRSTSPRVHSSANWQADAA